MKTTITLFILLLTATFSFAQSTDWQTTKTELDPEVVDVHFVDLAEKTQADLLYESPEQYETLKNAAAYIIFPDAITAEGATKKGVLFSSYEPLQTIEVTLTNKDSDMYGKAIIFETKASFESFKENSHLHYTSQTLTAL
ncbi:MAG: hypothetical protein CL868_08025 [Cytophagaceae bacterium]|nr:hypothetical protein [Cytophagaceae bacterium]|tara:strand:- start:2554 stop:2973 length:420 start_codon:yes stop_codon:yes gene_type:complete